MIVVIEDSPAIQDSLIDRLIPDDPFGVTQTINLIGSIDRARTLLKVDLSSYSGMTAITAKFVISPFVADCTNVSWYRVLRDWPEAEVTWNSYATGSPWDIAGCDGIGDREVSAQNPIPASITSLDPYDVDCLPESVDLDMGSYFSIIMIDPTSEGSVLSWSIQGSHLGDPPYFYMEYTVAEVSQPKNIRYMKQGDRSLLKRTF